MRIFVTGASGFVGSAIVNELISAGHQVLGMVRTDNGAEKVAASGAEVYRGDIYDLDSIKKGAATCDAVIHTAFNHDFSNFKANCETDRQVITALADVLTGTEKPLVITSAISLLPGVGRLATEDDEPAVSSDVMPRIASEEAAKAAAAKGVKVYVVRLPPTVHGAGDHGFIPTVIATDKHKGVSAYIGEGQNHWPAVHRQDAAAVYRFIIEKQPEQKIYHAVAQEGIPFREIAEAIGQGLNIPVESKTVEQAAEHFEWFVHFAALNCPASSVKTRATLNWQP